MALSSIWVFGCLSSQASAACYHKVILGLGLGLLPGIVIVIVWMFIFTGEASAVCYCDFWAHPIWYMCSWVWLINQKSSRDACVSKTVGTREGYRMCILRRDGNNLTKDGKLLFQALFRSKVSLKQCVATVCFCLYTLLWKLSKTRQKHERSAKFLKRGFCELSCTGPWRRKIKTLCALEHEE